MYKNNTEKLKEQFRVWFEEVIFLSDDLKKRINEIEDKEKQDLIFKLHLKIERKNRQMRELAEKIGYRNARNKYDQRLKIASHNDT